MNLSSIQLGSIERFWSLGHILIWGYGNSLAPKIRQEKLLKFIKILSYNKSLFLSIYLSLYLSIYLPIYLSIYLSIHISISIYLSIYIYIYIYFTKIIEIFWSRDVTDIGVLAHFELKIYKYFWTFYVFMFQIFKNSFKYSFGANASRKIRQEKNLNYVKMTRYSQRFLNYIKWQNVPILSNCIH